VTYDPRALADAPRTQMARITAKFGGVPALRDSLLRLAEQTGVKSHKRHLSAIYRWNLPESTGGTGGIIPRKAMPSILAAARNEGIVLTDADTDPRPR